DRVHYQHVAPWPTNTYGTGPSLSRVADNTYGNDYTSWKAELLRGSPGGPNFDTVPPTGNIIAVTPAIRHDPVNAINIVFSEPVANFDLSDLSLTVDGGKNLLTSAQ